MNDQGKLVTEPYRALDPPTDRVQQFALLLNDYRHEWLRIPLHQRDANAWPANKRQKYVERLRQSQEGAHPPGSFATYQLRNNGSISPTFLNDGLQRLTTLAELESNPATYGMDREGVANLLRQNISIQHRHYASHDDAMRDFQLINQGTQLTPRDHCSGYIKYMPNYDDQWKPLIARINEAVHHSDIRLQTSNKRQNRKEEHKNERHVLALFYRFMTGEKAAIHYPDVPANDVQSYLDKGDVIELRLRKVLLENGHDIAQKQAELFQRFIADETALIASCVHKALGEGVALMPTLHRWLLDVAVWRRHNKKARDLHEQLILAVLNGTKGRSQWIPSEGVVITFNLCHLGQLPKVAVAAGMPDFCVPVRRRRHASPLKAGYDSSHLEPFAVHGDGPTFPEPAPLNRARGAKPVEAA